MSQSVASVAQENLSNENKLKNKKSDMPLLVQDELYECQKYMPEASLMGWAGALSRALLYIVQSVA